MTSALDRHKISDREAVRQIISIVAGLGHDPATMPVYRRKRKEARRLVAEELNKKLTNTGMEDLTKYFRFRKGR